MTAPILVRSYYEEAEMTLTAIQNTRVEKVRLGTPGSFLTFTVDGKNVSCSPESNHMGSRSGPGHDRVVERNAQRILMWADVTKDDRVRAIARVTGSEAHKLQVGHVIFLDMHVQWVSAGLSASADHAELYIHPSIHDLTQFVTMT